jgi:isopenicillin-N N-acyltransferase-like protein
MESKPGRRRALRRHWVWISLGVLLLLLVTRQLFFQLTVIRPPAGAGQGAQRPRVEVRDGRVYVGDSWLSRERGILELHLSGEPFSLGYSHGRLGSPHLVQIEDYLFGEMRRYVPSSLALGLIKAGVMVRQRNLLDAVPVPLRFEMAGLAEGQPDGQGDFLPPFQRIVFYHALHDITQTIEHSPLLGCTALAAMGAATVDGHLYVGRNFDFEGPPLFDSDKAVLFFRPQGKLAFASVAWTGMAGVVTGINEAGIYVSVNALRTDDKSDRGLPVELLLRDVLERAHSLTEAIAVAREHPILVPDLYLFADGQTGEAAVVERSPTRFEVIRSRDILGVANHARTAPFAKDQANERLRTHLSSGARQARVDELLTRYRGSIDALGVQQILRDKRGPADKELGLGNRNALDALIATHSVVIDATERILWVSKGPHALGEYIGFDLRRELGDVSRPQPSPLPEDPVLHSPEYRNFQMMGQSLHAAEVARKHDQPELAIEEARRAVGLTPLSAEATLVLADLLWERSESSSRTSSGEGEDRRQARELYTRFLTLLPPHRTEVEHAESRLTALAGSAP